MAKTVSQNTLKKSFLNWFFWNGCSQQAETMLGMAFGQAMAPVIDELYETKEEKAAGLQRHITLFNTESQVGSVVNGIAIGMEEQLANGVGSAESIQEAFRPTREICSHPDCGKTVYPTEKLVFHGKPYHKLCFKCKTCNRSIAWGEQFERDDDPYCRACYAKLPVFKLEKA